jgi:integrase
MASKRGNDEGSIYLRSDGRWCASVSLGFDVAGKRKRQYLYGKTRKEVAGKLTEALKRAGDGIAPERGDVTVEALCRAYLEEAAPTLRATTLRSYRQMLETHVVPELGREKLAKLDARRLARLFREKQAAGLSPRSVTYLRTILRCAVQQAVRWEWASRNVVDLTTAPRAEKPPQKTFSMEQVYALREALSGTRHEALFTTVLGLGLRHGEALGLRWAELIYEGDELRGVRVTGQLQKPPGAPAGIVPPKSAAGVRTIALPGFVASAIQKRRAEYDEISAGWEPGANPLGLIFTTWDGAPLLARNVSRDLQKLLHRAGMEHLSVKDLRHLCASLLAAEKVPPRDAMEILGHSQISLTLNVYTSSLAESGVRAASALDRAVGKKKKDDRPDDGASFL